MKTYTTKANIERYLLISIDSSYDSQVENWIDAMSHYINRVTNRNFDAAPAESTKVYDGNNTTRLEIDNCYDLNGVTVTNQETSAVTTLSVYEYPSNGTVVDWLETDNITDNEQYFRKGKQNVSVTAKFGYPATPNQIEHACTVLVAGIVLAQTNQQGEVKSEKIGDYSVTYKDDQHKNDTEMVMQTLKQYRIHTI